jgi:hypothetical protein
MRHNAIDWEGFMSANTNYREPAFPTKGIDYGMTLRDYFAGQVISNCLDGCTSFREAVDQAYEIADEMIRARSA